MIKLKSVMKLINASHNIELRWEEEYDNGLKGSCYRAVQTTLYGNPTSPIEPELLEKQVVALFPAVSDYEKQIIPIIKLVIYLK